MRRVCGALIAVLLILGLVGDLQRREELELRRFEQTR